LAKIYKITKSNIERKLSLLSSYIREVYKDVTQYCRNKNCEWFEDCKRVRWTWLESYGKIALLKKIKSYCEMKRTINEAFSKALESS
jgi:hypothetical protein